MNHHGCDLDADARAAGSALGEVAKQTPAPSHPPSAPHPVARPTLHGHVFRRHAR